MLTRPFQGSFRTTTNLLTSKNSDKSITRQNSKTTNFETIVKIKSETHIVVFWKKNSRYPGELVGSRRDHGFSGRGHGCECDESFFIEKTKPHAFQF